jgi:hypothetical protein
MHGFGSLTFRERSQRLSKTWLGLLCLVLVIVTCVAAVHTHQDSDLDCAKHCASCASFHSAPPVASLSVVPVSFSVVASVTHSRPQAASALLSYSLYIRPPPAV